MATSKKASWFLCAYAVFSLSCGYVGSYRPSIVDVLNAIEKVANYYKDFYHLMNVDGVFGARIIEGQVSGILKSYYRNQLSFLDPTLVGRLHTVKDIIEPITWNAIPKLKKKHKDYYNLVGFLLKKPWTMWLPQADLDPELKWGEDVLLASKEYLINETSSDACLYELSKGCELSFMCQKILTTRGNSGYALTHQLLIVMAGVQHGCEHLMNIILKRNNFLGGTKHFYRELCTNVFYEVQRNLATLKNIILPRYQDLLVEQVFVCGSLGFHDLMKEEYLIQLLSWQKPSGCYGIMPRPKNSSGLKRMPPYESRDYDYLDDILTPRETPKKDVAHSDLSPKLASSNLKVNDAHLKNLHGGGDKKNIPNSRNTINKDVNHNVKTRLKSSDINMQKLGNVANRIDDGHLKRRRDSGVINQRYEGHRIGYEKDKVRNTGEMMDKVVNSNLVDELNPSKSKVVANQGGPPNRQQFDGGHNQQELELQNAFKNLAGNVGDSSNGGNQPHLHVNAPLVNGHKSLHIQNSNQIPVDRGNVPKVERPVKSTVKSPVKRNERDTNVLSNVAPSAGKLVKLDEHEIDQRRGVVKRGHITRKLLLEQDMPGECLAHKTAVSAAGLIVYLRYILEPGKSNLGKLYDFKPSKLPAQVLQGLSTPGPMRSDETTSAVQKPLLAVGHQDEEVFHKEVKEYAAQVNNVGEEDLNQREEEKEGQEEKEEEEEDREDEDGVPVDGDVGVDMDKDDYGDGHDLEDRELTGEGEGQVRGAGEENEEQDGGGGDQGAGVRGHGAGVTERQHKGLEVKDGAVIYGDFKEEGMGRKEGPGEVSKHRAGGDALEEDDGGMDFGEGKDVANDIVQRELIESKLRQKMDIGYLHIAVMVVSFVFVFLLMMRFVKKRRISIRYFLGHR